MPQTRAQQAAVISQSTARTIGQNIANTAARIKSLRQQGVSETDPTMVGFKKVRNRLTNQLERFINKQYADLQAHPNIAAIITDLDNKAKAAKAEAERLKDTAKRLNDFNVMLGNITQIVTALVRLAV